MSIKWMRHWRTRVVCWAFGVALLWTGSVRAADRIVIVGGLPGDTALATQYAQTIGSLRSLLVARGYSSDSISTLGGDSDTTATLKGFQGEMGWLANELKSSDTLLLVLIGHGQCDYVEAKFNLAGPDLTAEALGAMLDKLPARDQRLILAFPCSGEFSRVLAHPGRVMIASTDGPREIYDSVLPKHLLKALGGPDVDTDRNGSVTFYELFKYLSDAVANDYSVRGVIQTEHPSLEDNGDGDVTTTQEGMDAGDGALARRCRLFPPPASAVNGSHK